MAAPLRHRVELNAVRKLHFEFLEKPRELLLSFALAIVIIVYREGKRGRR